MQKQTTLANELWPLILQRLNAQLGTTGLAGGGGGGVAEHELGGAKHKGALRNDQGPQFLLTDGTRQLAGNMAVAAGITIDGVDLSAHAADPDAHHPKQHVLANASGLGTDHTISGAVAGWVLRATASNAARMAQLMVTDLGATGSNWDVAALTAANTVGLRTPSADVRTGAAEALLKSNAAGELGLAGLAVGAAMIFSGSNNIALYPDILFAGNGFLAAEQNLYISLDSDSATADNAAALIIGHDSPTTTGFSELFRFDEAGIATIAAKVRVPLLDTASGNMTFQPAGDVILDPGGNDVLPGLNYLVNLGAINKKFLTLWAAELWVETLVAQDTIATIGGRVLIGPTTTLTRDLAPTDTQVYVKHNQMSSGDKPYMEAQGKIEFFNITSGPTTISTNPPEYRYNVTRNLDGTGANQWYAGDALFNTGQTGNGFIDLYSLSGIPRQGQSGQRAGPTIVGNVRLGTNYNNFRERWAVGNLNALYDYGNNEYGAAFGDPTAAWIGMDAANGVRIMAGANVRAQLDINGNFSMYNSVGNAVITLDNTGASFFAGIMTIGTGGEIRQGTGALGTDYTGLRIWRDGSFGRIAGYNGNIVQWSADTDGRLRAGGGAVQLDAGGERIFRDTYVSASAVAEPGFGTAPKLTPVAAQALMLRDTSVTFSRVGSPASYNYPGNTVLRVYASSNHWTPYNDPALWLHYLDGVIEMPAITEAGDNNPYYRRLWLKAPTVVLDGYGRVTGSLQLDGGKLLSPAAVQVRNLADSAYQDLSARNLAAAADAYIYGGGVYSDVALRFLNTAAQAQGVLAGYLLASNSYAHSARVPANGLYVLGNISTSGGISSYADDLYIARAGVSKLGLFAWGTYAYGSLTLDDILNIAAVQATEPPVPATGVKIYLINRSGTIRLEGKFANGVVKILLTNV